jgi:hypothetical protein
MELIAALDRRVPQAQRAGEASIALDAAPLRARACHASRSSNASRLAPGRSD